MIRRPPRSTQRASRRQRQMCIRDRSQIKKAGKQLTTTGKKMALSPVPNIGQPQVCIRRMKNWKEKGHAINYQTLIDRLILQDK